ncbi:MAG: gas vesicle protein GvpG [Alkalicoccus sp.]|uniref:Gas vesicle protein GvpG n=1 Tax=Alkalicoccus saliphilus TaxID=200989 RepID=A0A2T4U7E2_9BACI|nr:gas vesicle protein GvpG [Alkalicoccus saliphilus]PTL39316.1 gas vesicle protein GvpG [Alkalicoccus saliphilus]TVP84803.1 MAG: gas vesicle protein GvpG [Alkalicoccus sp.]
MILKLFTWPIDTVKFVGEKVKEEVDKELYDLETIQKKLARLQMMLELEEISEELYEEEEEELLRRYRAAVEMQQMEEEER